ncbi:hypothetical protein HHL21_14540 [Massilia sp. RP-1-19]|uniref:Chitin-binding type-3 domain-containing protein n=1 Tax=Massilia polaris TaxID=2728846 RepID=A0A848HM40_9BURK|nr:hypothetical protein [Massilia polaris]NML62272.1 hypothetical protein [Massilia polaris]
MTVSARVMVTTEITASMIKAGTTIAATDAAVGEVAWVSGGVYAVDDQRTYGDSVWGCKLAHSGHAQAPDLDSNYWIRQGPTNRMAPFDDYTNTKAVATGSLTYVFQPGFLNGLAVYGMEGAAYSATVKDSPGGAVLRSWSGDLYSQASGFYELLFSLLVPTVQMSFDDIPLAPDAEVTITVSSDPGKRVAIGAIKVGDWRQFIGDGGGGGAQYGAESNRKSYTFRKYNFDGTYEIVKRASSRNVNCSVVIDADQAMYADSILGEIVETAVPFEASGLPGYGYLNTLGFVAGSIRADSVGTTSINLKIEGNI